MNKALVIGPTSTTTLINNNKLISIGKNYHSEIMRFLAGSMYTIAYDLAILETNPIFFTRFAYDGDGNTLNYELEKAGCTSYSNNHLLEQTPQKIYINDKNNITTSFYNINYDAYPGVGDGLAPIDFKDGDYAIVDIKDSIYFQKLIEHYPDLRFVGYNNIISDALIKNIEGIIYDYQTMATITSKSGFASYARALIDKGVKWVIVSNNGREVYLYQGLQQIVLIADEYGDYKLGTNEAFASMLIACLIDGMSLSEAVDRSLKLASDFSKINAVRLERDLFSENGD